jgi:tRNA dimethylallyltransferase
MHDLLKQADPETAARVDPADWKKISRALEVWESSGRPISELQRQTPAVSFGKYFFVYLDVPRSELYARINRRALEMVEKGLLEETASLLEKGYNESLNAMNTVGYKESIAYLKGEQSRERAIELIQRNTRHYAKRQETWFRKEPIDLRCKGLPEDVGGVLEAWQRAPQPQDA